MDPSKPLIPRMTIDAISKWQGLTFSNAASLGCLGGSILWTCRFLMFLFMRQRPLAALQAHPPFAFQSRKERITLLNGFAQICSLGMQEHAGASEAKQGDAFLTRLEGEWWMRLQ